MITKYEQNLWTYPADFICITTNLVIKKNGCLVMGAGIAKQAKERYPGIDQRWGTMVKLYYDEVFIDQRSPCIAFPTKYNWKDNSSIELICQSAKKLRLLFEHLSLMTPGNRIKIVLPPPGCGNGNLSWEKEIEPLLKGILPENNFVVCHKKNKNAIK